MLDKKHIDRLLHIAKRVRVDIVEMSYKAKSAHLGGSLSCVEVLTVLYFDIMRVNPEKPNDPDRDRLVFSKGHDAKAFYAVLCERGYFPKDILNKYEVNNGVLAGHTTRHSVPGIEVSSGSLGHGLPIACGMAFAGKLDKKNYRTFAILSDGECDEGSVWEAILFAGHHKLNNLTVVVDYNKLQGFGYTKDILDLEPFAKKWESFGWVAKEVNGHNFLELHNALKEKSKDKPMVIIANTIKGYLGPKKHVNQVSSQYKPPTEEEFQEVLKELSFT